MHCIELKDNLLSNFEKKMNENVEKEIKFKKELEEKNLEDDQLRKMNESLYQKNFYLEWDEYIKDQDKNRDEQDILSDKYLMQNPEEILDNYYEEEQEYKKAKLKKRADNIRKKIKKELDEKKMKELTGTSKAE